MSFENDDVFWICKQQKILKNLAALSFQEKIIQMCDKTQNKAYPCSPTSGILTIHPTQAFLLWFYHMNPYMMWHLTAISPDSARRNWGDTGTVITVILQGGILRWCWWTSAIVLGCFGAPHKAYITTGTLIVIMAGHHHLWIPNVSWIGWREQEAMEETIDVVCVFVPYNRSSNFVYVSLSTSSRNQQFLAAFSAL